jgi:hypothetical protein
LAFELGLEFSRQRRPIGAGARLAQEAGVKMQNNDIIKDQEANLLIYLSNLIAIIITILCFSLFKYIPILYQLIYRFYKDTIPVFVLVNICIALLVIFSNFILLILLLLRKKYCFSFNYIVLILNIVNVVFNSIVVPPINFYNNLIGIICIFILINAQKIIFHHLNLIKSNYNISVLDNYISIAVDISQKKSLSYYYKTTIILSFVFYIVITIYFYVKMFGRTDLYNNFLYVIVGVFGTMAAIQMLKGKLLYILFICLSLSIPVRITNLYTIMIIICLMILSQIPYILKQREIPRPNVLQKAHFKNGASFSDADFASFLKARSSRVWYIWEFYFPGQALSLAVALFLSKSIGGFVGNILAVAIMFLFLFTGLFIAMSLRKKSLKAAKKLGINESDVINAFQLKKRGAIYEHNDNKIVLTKS